MEPTDAGAVVADGAESEAGANGALRSSLTPEVRTRMARRYEALYQELERPARSMVRRAFGAALSDEEIEDVYSSAWLGTLRALARRDVELDEVELRRYVLTAVANHASKELRRRGRRPTAPLDAAATVADAAPTPEERSAAAERSRLTRDVIGSLPPRRRTVLILRYGWGLEPNEVCALVEDLSHRAYRREINRGVAEVAARLGLVERGEWCASRASLLRTYAAGEAGEEEQRQAELHLAHCRPCAEYVGKLSGHLHEIGTAVLWTGTAADEFAGGHLSIADRVGALVDRGREATSGLLTRGGSEPAEAATTLSASGGSRGVGGVVGAGMLAKLAGAGAAGKIAAACVGTGAAATACVAAGLLPAADLVGGREHGPKRIAQPTSARVVAKASGPLERAVNEAADQVEADIESGSGSEAAPSPASETVEEPESAAGVTDQMEVAPTGAPLASPAPTAPPEQQEFGLPGSASGSGGGGGGSGGGSGSGSSGGGGSGSVHQEFGP